MKAEYHHYTEYDDIDYIGEVCRVIIYIEPDDDYSAVMDYIYKNYENPEENVTIEYTPECFAGTTDVDTFDYEDVPF